MRDDYKQMRMAAGKDLTAMFYNLRARSWREFKDVVVDHGHMMRVLLRYARILRAQLDLVTTERDKYRKAWHDERSEGHANREEICDLESLNDKELARAKAAEKLLVDVWHRLDAACCLDPYEVHGDISNIRDDIRTALEGDNAE